MVSNKLLQMIAFVSTMLYLLRKRKHVTSFRAQLITGPRFHFGLIALSMSIANWYVHNF